MPESREYPSRPFVGVGVVVLKEENVLLNGEAVLRDWESGVFQEVLSQWGKPFRKQPEEKYSKRLE